MNISTAVDLHYDFGLICCLNLAKIVGKIVDIGKAILRYTHAIQSMTETLIHTRTILISIFKVNLG